MASRFIKHLRTYPGESIDKYKKRNPGLVEAFLQKECEDYFNDELKVYNALKRYQGSSIPCLMGPVRVVNPSPLPARKKIPKGSEDLLYVKGLLLEYLPGPTFTRLSSSDIPRKSWQALVDQAIRIPRILTKQNVINGDVRGDNIIATRAPNQACGYRAVMIDFGCCRFRKKNETDFDWGREKYL